MVSAGVKSKLVPLIVAPLLFEVVAIDPTAVRPPACHVAFPFASLVKTLPDPKVPPVTLKLPTVADVAVNVPVVTDVDDMLPVTVKLVVLKVPLKVLLPAKVWSPVVTTPPFEAFAGVKTKLVPLIVAPLLFAVAPIDPTDDIGDIHVRVPLPVVLKTCPLVPCATG